VPAQQAFVYACVRLPRAPRPPSGEFSQSDPKLAVRVVLATRPIINFSVLSVKQLRPEPLPHLAVWLLGRVGMRVRN